MRALVGIFVGGQSRRMGGIPKGLLVAPDTREPLVARIARITSEAIAGSEIVLVGANAAYRDLGFAAIDDAVNLAGPIAGLVALLEAAERVQAVALAIACDMPRLSVALVERLATYAPESDAVAARVDGIWQPLFARYAPARALPIARTVSAPFRVLDAIGATALPLAVDEHALLADWDTPEDVSAS